MADKSVLRIRAHDRQAEIISTVKEIPDGLRLEGRVDKTPFALNIASDGTRTGTPPKLDSAFEPICRATAHDLMKAKFLGLIPRHSMNPPTANLPTLNRQPVYLLLFGPGCGDWWEAADRADSFAERVIWGFKLAWECDQ
jgi:hypothetical protein